MTKKEKTCYRCINQGCAKDQCSCDCHKKSSEEVWDDAVNKPMLNAIKEFEKGGWHIIDIDKCRKFIKQVKQHMNL